MTSVEAEISKSSHCPTGLARRIADARSRRAEAEFDVSFDEDGRWRYVSTLPESEARRDVLLEKRDGSWTLRVNEYRGTGEQLLCDDAEWPQGTLLGTEGRLSYDDAVGHAIRWLSDGTWSDEIC